MIEGPVGAASFNNEFGRPALCGYFRTFEQEIGGERLGLSQTHHDRRRHGNHPRSNICGETAAAARRPRSGSRWSGHVDRPGRRRGLVGRQRPGPGRPGLRIGATRQSRDAAPLPGSHRRLLGDGRRQPGSFIHDVGAGGLSNALPELLNDGGHGGRTRVAAGANADSSMSPMEIWCNESQERYVLAIEPGGLDVFEAMCRRERCPFAVLGQATAVKQLKLTDELLGQDNPVDMPLEVLLGKPPRMFRDVNRARFQRRRPGYLGYSICGITLETRPAFSVRGQ